MSDSAPGVGEASPHRRHAPGVQGLVIVVLFATAGALAGVAWWGLWSPAPEGIVAGGQWFALPPTGSASQFDGTAWYVVVTSATGLLVALLVGLFLDRQEMLTLLAVVVGSVVAAWVCFRIGLLLAPPDPAEAARTAADGTRLAGTLSVEGLSPFLALPVGALLGLAVAFFGVTKQGSQPLQSGG